MKYAYLVAAHNQIGLLCKLLKALDDINNDIYLHIDIKAGEIDFSVLEKCLTKSKLYLLGRRSITWGAFSQINLELDFLKASIGKNYDYYHYISGVDFPIKSMKEIDAFLTEHKGKEFIHFDKKLDMEMIEYRIARYHFFQEKLGRTSGILEKVEKGLLKIQKVLKVNRIKNIDLDFRKGANWFSITNDLAHYVVECEKQIRKIYCKSFCADEIFLQTLVYNSKFKDALYYSAEEERFFNMRLIDWNRGNPYVYKATDFQELKQSECLFARKFEEEESKELIELLTK